MINPRSVAALGIGFGALAIASIGLLSPAVVVQEQKVGGGQAVHKVPRRADFTLTAFGYRPQIEQPRPKREPKRTVIAEAIAPVSSDGAAASVLILRQMQGEVALARHEVAALVRQAVQQVEQQRAIETARQEQDDEEAVILMMLAEL